MMDWFDMYCLFCDMRVATVSRRLEKNEAIWTGSCLIEMLFYFYWYDFRAYVCAGLRLCETLKKHLYREEIVINRGFKWDTLSHLQFCEGCILGFVFFWGGWCVWFCLPFCFVLVCVFGGVGGFFFCPGCHKLMFFCISWALKCWANATKV